MLEKLFPLKLPPGLVNNGTTYQSKDRWFKGSLVRFFNGNIEPVGGWVQRTLTGAAIVGVPNAAVSWQANDGSNYLAIGTTTNLYVITSANVVSDITPPNVVGDGLVHRWQLENFGSFLVATFNRSNGGTATGNFYAWAGDVTVAATVDVGSFAVTPGYVFGLTVTPERFFVLLRGGDPPTFASPVPGFVS